MAFEPNKIEYDENNNPNGILLLNKPKGITSHDLVDQVRKQYKTRRVGHAGALDPFAEGLMIVLVGKATKLSDSFLGLDKEYIAEILFGIETNSGDPEGEISKIKDQKSKVDKDKLDSVLKSFLPSYEQYVPVFSSVKVQGNKLRELARRSDGFDIFEDGGVKKVRFMQNEKQSIILDLPKKMVKVNEVEVLEFDALRLTQYVLRDELIAEITRIGQEKFQVAKVRVRCSKGTFIRQLAIDIGEKLEIPAMLIGLKRTRIGDFRLTDIAS